MPTLPAELLPLIIVFARLFSKRVWEHAQVLLVGAVLAPGKRTVTTCLRVTGKSHEKHFQNYHRVLSRARWSALQASRLLLRLLVRTFAPEGELIIGIDDTTSAEARREDQGQGHLPRSGSLFALAPGQGERPAAAVLHVAPQDRVGGPRLGAAVPDRAQARRSGITPGDGAGIKC